MIQNDRLGYYTVGGQKFYSKIEACAMATKLDQYPQWHFNDNTWQATEWRVEPAVDILQLYQERARQIRERYDYVIIMYSAGSDSETMVEAFLSAGCHIDEIRTVWNRKHTAKVDTSGQISNPINIEAEYDLTTRPGLDRIKAASPQTKIVYVDISDAVIQQFDRFDGEEWLTTTPEFLHPQYVTRWEATRDRDQLLQLDRGQRTVILFGVDKPRVCIRDGRYCVYFLDIIANSFRGGWNRPEYTNLDYEFFYWSPDMPAIIVKQAHMIRQWFEHNPKLRPLLVWPNLDYIKRQAYEVIVRSIIYPAWDIARFQCAKVTSTVWSEWDHWFFTSQQSTTVYESWLKGLTAVQNRVDRRFLNYDLQGRFDGFVGMINGHFYLED